MVKSKNIIAGLGVVAGLGMALLPLGAFAEGEPSAESGGNYIRAHVGEVIEIAVTNNKQESGEGALPTNYARVELTPGGYNNEIIHTVNVTSNARGGYQLLMKSDRKNLELINQYQTGTKIAATDGYNANINIPGLDAESALGEGQPGWGYKINTTESWTGNFKPVPTAYDETVGATIAENSYRTSGSYRTDTAKYTDTYKINFGIRAKADQPSGSYEAKVTYKAVAHVLGDQ